MGSTQGHARAEGGHGDHPHIHGEHSLSAAKINGFWGSPPYTWGALTVPE